MIGSSLSDQPELDRPIAALTGYRPAAAEDGPATVVNPELRQRQDAVLARVTSPFDSDLGRRLFPADHSSINIESPPSPSGCRLGHFCIEELIGRGGMGAVFRAIDDRLDRVIALKVLAPNFSRDPSTVERFRNEARAAARLDHENIARVFFTGEDHGVHFIAHEFVAGTNLRDLIRERGRLSPVEAVNYTLQMASALRHTSSAGVVHRDIKPSNIIITPSGRAKLVDLGLARKEYSESAPELTIAGTTLGTFDYISPEQAKDPRDVDVRSDIYSLGCTLYHMLTGEPPYPEGTFFKRLLDRQDKAPPNPALKAPGLSPTLIAVVQRMMAAEPRMRHANAESLTGDLMQLAGEMGLRGIPPEGLVWTHASKLQRGGFWERNFGLLVTAAALLLIVFAIERFSHVDPPNDANSAVRSPGQRERSTSSRKSSPSSLVPGKAEKPPRLEQQPPTKTTITDVHIKQPTLIAIDSSDADGYSREILGGISGIAGSTEIPGVSSGSGEAIVGTGKTIGVPPSPSVPGTGVAVPNPAIAEVSPERPFAVLSNDGVAPRSYTTLEAACTTAGNGQIVELNFDGVRRNGLGQPVDDLPIRVVDKSITIRAGQGFHPVIRFAAGENAKPRMITVFKGKLNVINTGLVLQVTERNDQGDDNRWVLFSLQGADHLVLRGVHATIENLKGQTASLVEINQRTGPSLAKNMSMKKEDGNQPDRFEITVTDSFIRCDANVLTVNHPRGGSLEIRNSAVVVEQSLLHLACEQVVSVLPESATVELKLQHTTVLTGQPTLNIQTGLLPGPVMQIRVNAAKDNLFAAKSAQPFVLMTGNSNTGDFRQTLKWDGEKNFYDRFKTLWTINSDIRTEEPQAMTFRDWQDHWKDHEVTARTGEVPWKQNWAGKSASSFSLKDLEFDTTADTERNFAATDSATIGADLISVAKPEVPQRSKSATP